MFKMAKQDNEAITLAKQMAKTGEKLLPLAFGDGDSMFIASESDLIRALDAVVVDDVMYFIGFKK